jgi:DNA-binding NtrC family response regulator
MKKILILSSNAIIGEELYKTLKEHGHKPKCWRSLEGLMEKINQEKPDLIITNFQLFGYRDEHVPIDDGGIIALKKLIKAGKNIPVIFFYENGLQKKAIDYYYRIQKLRDDEFRFQINVLHYPLDQKAIIEKADKM